MGRKLYIIGLALLLSGCGFHMRQAHKVKAQSNPFYLSTTNLGLQHLLTQQLQQQGANFVNDRKQASTVINLTDVQQTSNIISRTNTSTQGSVYSLSSHASVQLFDQAGKPLDKKREFYTRENLSIGPNDSLSTNRQAPEIHRQLQGHLVQQVASYITTQR